MNQWGHFRDKSQPTGSFQKSLPSVLTNTYPSYLESFVSNETDIPGIHVPSSSTVTLLQGSHLGFKAASMSAKRSYQPGPVSTHGKKDDLCCSEVFCPAERRQAPGLPAGWTQGISFDPSPISSHPHLGGLQTGCFSSCHHSGCFCFCFSQVKAVNKKNSHGNLSVSPLRGWLSNTTHAVEQNKPLQGFGRRTGALKDCTEMGTG